MGAAAALWLWDEWTALPQGDEATDSAELAGLVAALPFKKSKQKGEGAFLETSRLWALRRLARLWKNSMWKDKWNVAASLSVPSSMKGRVELSLPGELYDAVISCAPDAGNGRWAWVRGVGERAAPFAARDGR
jgi:hypothetical protein